MRFIIRSGLALLLTALSPAVPHLAAQGAGSSAEIQQKLTSEFTLTKITDDRSDIVTAGAVLLLHKDGVVMYSTPTAAPAMNVYRDGRIGSNAASNIAKVWGKSLLHGGTVQDAAASPQRKFVSGEKFWLTGVNIQDDGVVLNVYSDAYNDVRYYGQIKFPFPKHNIPPTADVVKAVEEVVTVAPTDNAADDSKSDSKAAAAAPAAPAPAPAAPAPAPMAAIPPPPPPPDAAPPQPKTISLGQTKDAVVANWGQPTKIVKLASKEIYYYPDMKVTFVAGKVSNVE